MWRGTDPSIIYVSFSKKLDPLTANNVANYSIGSTHPISAQFQTNMDTGATVVLTFASGAFQTSGDNLIRIENIKGYNGSYTTMDSYATIINLVENTPPTLQTYKKNGSTIELTFSEAITGVPDFNVYSNNFLINGAGIGTCYITDCKVIIVINTNGITSNAPLLVQRGTNCDIKDMNNNVAFIPQQFYVALN